jgi:hypothetical protein
MIAIALLSVLLAGGGQESDSTPAAPSQFVGAVSASPQLTPEQQAEIKQKQEQFRLQHEPERQEAIRLNDLAAKVHSEADARKFVDGVAEQITHEPSWIWTALNIRRRLAHAEYEAVSNPSGSIPEKRIVDVWNEYVREIDAPAEALITVPEFHAFRQIQLWNATNVQWKHDTMQSIWTMPNIYARDAEGQLEAGCRALEALKLIHEMHERFSNLLIARDRLAKGLPFPDVAMKTPPDAVPAKAHWELRATLYQNPVLPAAYRYQQEHGSLAYDQLAMRLFNELMPAQ